MSGIENQYKRIREAQEGKKFRDEPIPITAILDDIDHDIMVIPEFQREFVWEMDKIVTLFDSIYRGYTIGNLLLWKTNEELAHKKVGEKETLMASEGADKEYTYLLDGQQRLTSLYAVLRGKPILKEGNKYPKTIKIFFDIQNDEFMKENTKLEDFGGKTIKKLYDEGLVDDFRFIDLSKIFDKKQNFPYKLVDYERKKIEENVPTLEEYKKKNAILESKKKDLEKFVEIFRHYTIPQIVDRDQNIDRVVTIFERINTQNIRLDIFDIMVAKTYRKVYHEEQPFTFNLNKTVDKILYMKDLNNDFLYPDKDMPDDENLYYGIYHVTLLRLISIICGKKYEGRIALQKSDIYNLEAQFIQDNIVLIRRVLQQIHRFFKNELNINDIDEDLTDNKILSFLSYIFVDQMYTDISSDLLKKWFWNSMIFNRFPGAQLQLIEKDISKYDSDIHNFYSYIKQRRNMTVLNTTQEFPDFFLLDAGYTRKNNLYVSLILLLNSLRPKDFNGKDEINISEYIGSETKNNKHHIIPYNSNAATKLRKKYGEDKANFMLNNIANIAIISSQLNKEISGKDPKVYFQNYEDLPNFGDILKKHLIDNKMYKDLINENYEKFLQKRTDKITSLIIDRCRINQENIVLNSEENGS